MPWVLASCPPKCNAKPTLLFLWQTFQEDVKKFWQDALTRNNHRSIIESKKLIAAPRREKWHNATVRATSALADSFVRGDPLIAFENKRKLLESKSKSKI